MKQEAIRATARILYGIAGMVALPTAHADVFINQTSLTFGGTPNNSQFGAKYRITQGAWDMGLGSSVNNLFLSQDIGHVADLSGRTFLFTLERVLPSGNNTGGFVWSLATASGTPILSYTQSWLTSPNAFNTLKIEARGLNSGNNIGTMEFWDLSFTGTGLGTQVGSFDAGTATNTTNSPAYFGQTSPTGTYTQWLWSTDNLATKAWKMTGRIKGTKNYNGQNENVRFQISGLNAGVIPEPGTLALLGIGFGTALLADHRRRSPS